MNLNKLCFCRYEKDDRVGGRAHSAMINGKVTFSTRAAYQFKMLPLLTPVPALHFAAASIGDIKLLKVEVS